MKKFVMVAGPPGVGKTAVCRRIFQSVDGCAWLDGDWCWMVNPYPGKTEAQKTYAERAFGYILDGYMLDPNTRVILFSWMIQHDFMFDLVTDRMARKEFELTKVALVCEEAEYIRRLRAGGREAEKIERPDDMGKYRALDAHVIDTTGLTVAETADRVLGLL